MSEGQKRKIGNANKIALLGNTPWNKGTKGLTTSWNKGVKLLYKPRPKAKKYWSDPLIRQEWSKKQKERFSC